MLIIKSINGKPTVCKLIGSVNHNTTVLLFTAFSYESAFEFIQNTLGDN